jgi:TolB-like protein
MSFFEELKRRNVFRVGIAYGIVAWFVLQVADLVFDNIGAPEWVIKALMFLVGLGFIAALVIAWAYELTPEGIKRETDISRDDSITGETGKKLNAITLAAVLALIVFMVVDRFVLEEKGSEHLSQTSELSSQPGEQESDLIQAGPDPDSEPGEQSIAVLPFVDMSPEGDQAYFADGIAEEILNVLVKTHSLKVAGRTSSFQFRDRSGDLREIGEQLGVEHVLEGSIRKAGNRLRITAQLVKADDGFHLWSETYDRELTDVFAIQDEIARAITEALAIELALDGSNESLAKVQTSNMDAYDRYLEARALVAQREDFPRMIRLLEEATQLDPDFAEGWATLAQAWALTFYYGVKDRNAALREAERFARRAIELDPNLSAAHSALGDALRDQLLWSEALVSYQRALDLNPDNIETHSQLGQMLMRAGFAEQALEHSTAATELDPLSWVNQAFHGVTNFLSGNKDEAWRAINKAEVLADFGRSLVARFKIRMALSDGLTEVARQSVDAFMEKPRDDERLDDFHFQKLVGLLDEPERARQYLREINYQLSPSLGADVFWAAYFDDFDLADTWMKEVLGRHDIFDDVDMVWVQFPAVHPLFNRDEFRLLMKRSRLDMFWREYGWPDFCRPVNDHDFECGAPNEQ